MIRNAIVIFLVCGSFSLGFIVDRVTEKRDPTFSMSEILAMGQPVMAQGAEGSFYIVGDGRSAMLFAIAQDGRYSLVGATNTLMLSKSFMRMVARMVGISV
jgi:hypothetical protein